MIADAFCLTFRLEVSMTFVAYRLRATKAFGFGKSPFSQTRWRF